MDGTTRKHRLAPGLYLVATPIGNLGDITLRALDVLRGVDRIACEDTRQTQKLLNHFEIATPTVSCHQHNERQRAAELMEALKAGGRIAVVSDAGMPGISDPGTWLATEAIAAGVPVIPIPGANAALSALVASGLPDRGSFTSSDFCRRRPERDGRAWRNWRQLQGSETTRTLIFYEAPHRILETLADLESVWGAELRVVVARELTKIHEEFLRGTVGGGAAGTGRAAIAFAARLRCWWSCGLAKHAERNIRRRTEGLPSGSRASRPKPASMKRKR